MSPSDGVVELVGVYNADGGVAGEVRYVVGHLLGRAHCSLCDITHSPVRRKRAWDRMVGRTGCPVPAAAPQRAAARRRRRRP